MARGRGRCVRAQKRTDGTYKLPRLITPGRRAYKVERFLFRVLSYSRCSYKFIIDILLISNCSKFAFNALKLGIINLKYICNCNLAALTLFILYLDTNYVPKIEKKH